MARLALSLCFLIAAAQGAAAEEEWRATTRACDQWAEASICIGKNGCPSWQWLTECTAKNFTTLTPHAQVRLDWCVQQINDNRRRAHTPAMSGDPVAEAMGCLMATH